MLRLARSATSATSATAWRRTDGTQLSRRRATVGGVTAAAQAVALHRGCTAHLLHTHCCAAHAASAADAATASPATAPSSSTSATAAAAAAAAPARPVVRVRYAPSPTGSVHLGGLRTALYNYLFAKKSSAAIAATPNTPAVPAVAPGQFLLRIEDTDQKRLVPTAVDELCVALRWAGLVNDEGPGAATQGDCGPYVQSERLPIYQKHVQTLLDHGHAYPCFCSSERLTELREMQTKKGLPSMYDRLCLGMEDSEREEKLKECKEKNIPYVIRMKVPHGSTTIKDMIRGQVNFPNKTLDDQVLLKSDGFPTYHLACVVDDHLMRISHVIRGDEWLTSTPKHVILYRMFGWTVPQFAHLPLLLKPDGTKLSKRHADSSLEYYISRGYLPEAVINFVAMLGWNPGSTQEVFSLPQLVEAFSLERIQKAGAVVNLDKLNWFNQQHLQRMAAARPSELMDIVRPKIVDYHRQANAAAPSTGASLVSESDLVDDSFLQRVVFSLVPHVTHVTDFVSHSLFYFCTPDYKTTTDEKLQQLRQKVFADSAATELNKRLVAATIAKLESLPAESFVLPAASSPSTAATPSAASSTPAPPSLQDALKSVIKEQNVKQKQYFLLLRYIFTGSETGPSLSVMLATFGRDRALQRLRNESAYTP